ncbi:MAG: hypothetical protein F6K45_11735 [Kamptonema sp. SIO1D9]|nr:hypothetical protein [Kamptonema sp. SIO1D9]
MIKTYTVVAVHNKNQGSYGRLSQTDKDQILSLLNSKNYKSRVDVSGNLVKLLGQITSKLNYPVSDNCHTLARKMKEKTGLRRICGYIFKEKYPSQGSIVLRSHSVIEDQSVNLIELTTTYNTQCYPDYNFIEHPSGEYGIDLRVS